MTRPSEITRERIMKAAERLFAEHGYEGTSVRAIVAKARVNQAAINYHFAGKEALYREVLRTAFRALTAHQLAHAEEAKAATREAALGAFVRRQLQPLSARDEFSRHLRIFNWEAAQPTAVFRKLMSEEAAPFMSLAVDLVPAQSRATGGAAAQSGVRRTRSRAPRRAGEPLGNRRPDRAGVNGTPTKSLRLPQKFLVPGRRVPRTRV
jgi:AcrR family transcriptional regulator